MCSESSHASIVSSSSSSISISASSATSAASSTTPTTQSTSPTSTSTVSTQSTTTEAICTLDPTASGCLLSAADYEQSADTLNTLALPLDTSTLDTSSDVSIQDGTYSNSYMYVAYSPPPDDRAFCLRNVHFMSSAFVMSAASDGLVNVQSVDAVTNAEQFQVVIFYDDTADMTLIANLDDAIKQSSNTPLANAAVFHLSPALNSSDAVINEAVLAITSVPVVYLGFCSLNSMYLLSQKVRLSPGRLRN